MCVYKLNWIYCQNSWWWACSGSCRCSV